MPRVWLNGASIQDSALASASVERGLGVFETLRIQSRIPLHLSAHLDRLARSCAHLGLPEPAVDLEARLRQLAAETAAPSVLRVQLGRGLELIRVSPFNQARWGAPITLASVAPGVLDLELAEAKHCSRGHWERGAAARGVDELLFIDPDGFLLETHQGNVFAQVGAELHTPPLDGRLLPGVTRAALLSAGRAAGLALREAPVHVSEVRALWVSSSLKGLAPVAALDGSALGEDQVGAALLAVLEGAERS